VASDRVLPGDAHGAPQGPGQRQYFVREPDHRDEIGDEVDRLDVVDQIGGDAIFG
jgi:hypothetical protein